MAALLGLYLALLAFSRAGMSSALHHLASLAKAIQKPQQQTAPQDAQAVGAKARPQLGIVTREVRQAQTAVWRGSGLEIELAETNKEGRPRCLTDRGQLGAIKATIPVATLFSAPQKHGALRVQ